MLRSKIKYTILLVACFLLPSVSQAEDAECAIVYGKDWAFFFNAPKGWKAACPGKKSSKIAVALWPEDSTFADAPAVMYLTISGKGDFSLEQFADDELARFYEKSPNIQVEIQDSIPLPDNHAALVRKLTGDQFGNHELVAYMDGKTVYLILVLTSRTQEGFDRFHSAFSELVSTVKPMTIEFQDGAKKPGAQDH